MAKMTSRDLFDDTTMSFGEHLEALRTHLIRALIGLVIGVTISLFYANNVIYVLQWPMEKSLRKYFSEPEATEAATADISKFSWWGYLFGAETDPAVPGSTNVIPAPTATTPLVTPPANPPTPPQTAVKPPATVGTPGSPPPESGAVPPRQTPAVPTSPATGAPTRVGPPPEQQMLLAEVDALELWNAFRAISPDFPAPPPDAQTRKIAVRIPRSMLATSEVPVKTTAAAGVAKAAGNDPMNPLIMATTFSPEEAFLVYIKVALISGLVLSSPWVFYQLWLFVAAGLYPHEQKYIYTYLPMSLGLFLGGAALCFFAVIPLVLDFLFSFNKWLNILPQIRITEWISFAVMLPVMFGISFQLPLVMLFLEKINIFTADTYRQKRRISILVISIIAMILTPSDPMSMLMMMIPLVILYEVGILLCGKPKDASPFEPAKA